MARDDRPVRTWCADDLGVVTNAVEARDALVECFRHAQAETFARQRERLGVSADPPAVESSIRGAIRSALAAVGGDFDQPTKKDLEAAIGMLARKAKTWGTPADIIDHHMAEMKKVLAGLNDE